MLTIKTLPWVIEYILINLGEHLNSSDWNKKNPENHSWTIPIKLGVIYSNIPKGMSKIKIKFFQLTWGNYQKGILYKDVLPF